eukprot:TRINITY_DN8629_c0_g1_i1.p1 TRINITY_DN8629_c0_g1~~TRINITY_DN8629_c0_g1_i1.p1  ORF type:complete len:531 (-),score=100.37 TRINITY_DN8629_c0_g1_i1:52-1524(-)
MGCATSIRAAGGGERAKASVRPPATGLSAHASFAGAPQRSECFDGNTAAAYVAYALSDVAFVFPIAPSSEMGEYVCEWAAQGRLNVFGQRVEATEMQSEAGVAGALHGACAFGSLATTFTSSQGLLLMIPNMFKIAGELLPCVIHVATGSIAMHARCAGGDHTDVMACRTTGFAMLSSHSVQEALDMALIAHVASLQSSLPFLHFFDGFRTSHELAKIRVMSYEDIRAFAPLDAVQQLRECGLNPKRPHLRGTSQGPDVYFQCVEAANKYHNAVPAVVERVMHQFASKFGRVYHLFEYYGDPTARWVVIAVGSSAATCAGAVDRLRAGGKAVGFVAVHLLRPFSAKHLIAVVPRSVQAITVLERTKERGTPGDPLYLDVCAAFSEEAARRGGRPMPRVLGGRYGLGSKEFTPGMAAAVFVNMFVLSMRHFAVGIDDDVGRTSLKPEPEFEAVPAGTTQCVFWGGRADGASAAARGAVAIIAANTPLFVQV